MVARDYKAMKSVALRSTPDHMLDWKSVSACMNPGRGITWVDAVEEPQPDGSVHLPQVTCMRNNGPWKCDTVVVRELRFALPEGAGAQPMVVRIPMEFDVTDVRVLAARALEIVPGLTWKDACGVDLDRQPTESDKAWEEEIHTIVNPQLKPIEAEIQEAGDTTTFMIGLSLGLEFSKAEKKASDKKFKCWSTIIVVA
jgi:hypothetical protein